MTTAPPAIASDPGLPGARGLFTGDGVRAVNSFLEERGWAMEDVRPVQTLYRPGRGCSVRFRVRASGPRGRATLSICAETRARRTTPAPVQHGFEERFGFADPVGESGGYLVWTFPYDPSLRELPDAAWGGAQRDRLPGPERPLAVAVEPLRYRARRRGVFRYRALHEVRGGREWRTWYGKVIPRRKASRSLEAAPVLARSGLPMRLALPEGAGEQSLLLPSVEGSSLRDLLVRGGPLPAPERLAALPVVLAAGVDASAVTWERPSADVIAQGTRDLLEPVVPHAASQVSRVVDAVLTESTAAAQAVVHGDLYEAQILVGDRYSLGLIDLDDLALGDPLMDAANLSAHLVALALALPAAAGRLVAYRRLLRRALLDTLGASSRDLAWREALCMLQLAAGPFRVLSPNWPEEVGRRVGVAVRLLEDA